MALRISAVLYVERINSLFYRDCLESIVAAGQYYDDYEVVVLDATGVDYSGTIAKEFFPEEGRLIYRKLRADKNKGYILNMAYNYSTGDVLYFLDDAPRLQPDAFFYIAEAFKEDVALVYSDNDELVGMDRMHPNRKPDLNVELLRHRNYIGNVFAVERSAFRQQKGFFDNLNSGVLYDFILRAIEVRLNIVHISKLLYSVRKYRTPREEEKERQKTLREQSVVVEAHLKRQGILATIRPSTRRDFLYIKYDHYGYKNRKKDYILIREKGVHVSVKTALPIMYGYLKQPDVGMVGVSFLRNPFIYDNCGYIFNENGLAFPVAKGQNILFEGVGYRCLIPQDVSMVDLGFCLIKKRLFQKLGGFDRQLASRDMALDFCLKVQRAGYRVVFEPDIKALRPKENHDSTEQSSEMIKEKWKDVLEGGDRYYNRKLPMGLTNYVLY